MSYKKKLIEVALPLEAINKESAREKPIRHGHPSTLHLWWARRPLAARRAVLFASLMDDQPPRPVSDGGRQGAGAALRHHQGVGKVGEREQQGRAGASTPGDPQERRTRQRYLQPSSLLTVLLQTGRPYVTNLAYTEVSTASSSTSARRSGSVRSTMRPVGWAGRSVRRWASP